MNFVFKIFMFSIFIFNISCLPGGSSFGGVFGIRTAPEKSIYAFDLGQETFQGKTENFLKYIDFLRKQDPEHIIGNQHRTHY